MAERMVRTGLLDSTLAATAVARVLRRLETEAKQSGRRLTRDLIARDVDISRSTVSAWFAGKQTPRPKQLESLAAVLSFHDDIKRMEYRRDLFQAAGVPLDRSNAQNPLVRARERSAEIVVGIATYDEVAIDQFFEDVVRAFGDFCGFLLNMKRVPFKELAESIASGDIDIGAGLWETPERLLSLRYVGMPIEMGMNALIFADAKEKLPQRDGLYDVEAISPIMNEGQATYRFAQHVLGIPKHKIVTCDYNIDAFASHFIRSFQEWKQSPIGPIPVLISDEAMCLKVHNRLLSGMVVAPDELLRRSGLPLLLMDGRREVGAHSSSLNSEDPDRLGGTQWGRNGKLIAAHPRYNLSLCVRRTENDEWFPYVEDAWRIFIRGNREFLASKYLDLCLGISGLVREAKHVLARAAEFMNRSEASILASKLGERWEAVACDWLFDNELRDFHDEQTWNNILKHVVGDESFPAELHGARGDPNANS
jgi:transcriptional regulator with XRE-family HTH domain